MVSNTTDMLLKELTSQGVLRLTLNDPERCNALSKDMLQAMFEALAAAEADPAVRVVILCAKGSVFCAGHDLKELNSRCNDVDDGKAFFKELFFRCSEVMQMIVKNSKTIIAEVNGVATAAGCQLVASCDLALAAENAKFATPGVNIGLFCATPMVALSRNVSNKHAMEMLLTGDMISATKAEKIGLINRVVNVKELTKQSMAMANKIASKSSMTLTTGKYAFYQQRDMCLADAYRYASQCMVDNMFKQDAREGINTFVKKCHPKWQDK
jgi:enoyl-CoA hydratase/carnithine racemase